MVGHQATGMNLPVRRLAGFRQRLEKILPVHIVQENILPPVAAAHDMVHGARILNAQFAWHELAACGKPPLKPNQ
jgi:hypothetical protein